jgi:hypothetical protein
MIVNLLITNKKGGVMFISRYYTYFTRGDMAHILSNPSKKIFDVKRANPKLKYIYESFGEMHGYIVSFYIDVLNKAEKWIFGVKEGLSVVDFDMLLESIIRALKTVKKETNLTIYGSDRIYTTTIAPEPSYLIWV